MGRTKAKTGSDKISVQPAKTITFDIVADESPGATEGQLRAQTILVARRIQKELRYHFGLLSTLSTSGDSVTIMLSGHDIKALEKARSRITQQATEDEKSDEQARPAAKRLEKFDQLRSYIQTHVFDNSSLKTQTLARETPGQQEREALLFADTARALVGSTTVFNPYTFPDRGGPRVQAPIVSLNPPIDTPLDELEEIGGKFYQVDRAGQARAAARFGPLVAVLVHETIHRRRTFIGGKMFKEHELETRPPLPSPGDAALNEENLAVRDIDDHLHGNPDFAERSTYHNYYWEQVPTRESVATRENGPGMFFHIGKGGAIDVQAGGDMDPSTTKVWFPAEEELRSRSRASEKEAAP